MGPQETDNKDGYVIASFTSQEEEVALRLGMAPDQTQKEKALKTELGYFGAERGHKAWTAVRTRLEASGHLQVRCRTTSTALPTLRCITSLEVKG